MKAVRRCGTTEKALRLGRRAVCAGRHRRFFFTDVTGSLEKLRVLWRRYGLLDVAQLAVSGERLALLAKAHGAKDSHVGQITIWIIYCGS